VATLLILLAVALLLTIQWLQQRSERQKATVAVPA
jgi:hypothetical protein